MDILCPFAAVSPWTVTMLEAVRATTGGKGEAETLEDVAGTEPTVKGEEETFSAVGIAEDAVSFCVAIAEADMDAGADTVDMGGDADNEELGEDAMPAKDSER